MSRMVEQRAQLTRAARELEAELADGDEPIIQRAGASG